MKTCLAAAIPLLAAFSLPALAGVNVSLPLEPDAEMTILSMEYQCDPDETYAVQYVNAGGNSLALVPIDGKERIFVNVIAASGARYVSGEYEWWTKGSSATLTNLSDPDNPRDCHSAEGAAEDGDGPEQPEQE